VTALAFGVHGYCAHLLSCCAADEVILWKNCCGQWESAW
jgi:hypothetical protein